MRVVRSSRFKRDVKRLRRRGKDLDKLRRAIVLIVEGRPLPENYRDHSLGGSWRGYRDLYLEPDWILIYRVAGDELRLARTGRHADIFER